MPKKITLAGLILVILIMSILIGCINAPEEENLCDSTFSVINSGEKSSFNLKTTYISGKAYVDLEEICKQLDIEICSSQNEGEIILITDENLCLAKEGELNNGRKYIYSGITENDFDLNNYFKENKMTAAAEYEEKVVVKVPKDVAEISQEYLGLDETPIDKAGILLRYDTKTDS